MAIPYADHWNAAGKYIPCYLLGFIPFSIVIVDGAGIDRTSHEGVLTLSFGGDWPLIPSPGSPLVAIQ